MISNNSFRQDADRKWLHQTWYGCKKNTRCAACEGLEHLSRDPGRPLNKEIAKNVQGLNQMKEAKSQPSRKKHVHNCLSRNSEHSESEASEDLGKKQAFFRTEKHIQIFETNLRCWISKIDWWSEAHGLNVRYSEDQVYYDSPSARVHAWLRRKQPGCSAHCGNVAVDGA